MSRSFQLKKALFISLEVAVILLAFEMIYKASMLPSYPFSVFEIEHKEALQNKNTERKESKEEEKKPKASESPKLKQYVIADAEEGIEIKSGDRIIGISGRRIRDKEEILFPLRHAKPGDSISLLIERDTILRFYSVSLSPSVVVTPDSVISTRAISSSVVFKEKISPLHRGLLFILLGISTAILFVLNHRGKAKREARKGEDWQALWLTGISLFLLLGAHFPGEKWEALAYRATHVMLFPILTLFLLSRFKALWKARSKRLALRNGLLNKFQNFPLEPNVNQVVWSSGIGFLIAIGFECTLWFQSAGFGESQFINIKIQKWGYVAWHWVWMIIFLKTIVSLIEEVKMPNLRIRERDALARKSGFYLIAFLIPLSGYFISTLLPAIIHTKPPSALSVFLSMPLAVGLCIGGLLMILLAELRFTEERIEQITPRGIKRASEWLALMLIGGCLYAVLSIFALPLNQQILMWVLISLVAAVSFQPAATGIKNLSERWFFQAQQNTRELLSGFDDALSQCLTREAMQETMELYLSKALGVEEAPLFGASESPLLCFTRERNRSAKRSPKFIHTAQFIVRKTRLMEGRFGIWLNPSVSTVRESEGNGYMICTLPRALVEREIGGIISFSVTTPQSRKFEKSRFMCIFPPKLQGALFYDDDIKNLLQLAKRFQAYDEKWMMEQEALWQAEESRRLREIGSLKTKMLAGVSHDLRTPLASIKLFSELLKNGVAPDQQEKYLSIIEGESDRLSRLISSILNYARLESREYETLFSLKPIFLSKAMTEVLQSMAYQFSLQNFSVETEIQAKSDLDEPMIYADEGLLKQVIENLLSNAIKYAQETKKITLKLRWDKSVVLRIKDDGIGINEKDLPRIFDAYYRSESAQSTGQGGFGIGLSFVKMVLDFHGASIECQSEEGKGSEFILTFPLQTKQK